MKKWVATLGCLLLIVCVAAQSSLANAIWSPKDTAKKQLPSRPFLATSALLDAAINSINSLNSLIKKEAYRNKIAAFNNPTSSDLGFNLEQELQSAIKPLLAKAKNTNGDKFAQVVSSLVRSPVKGMLPTAFGASTVFTSLMSLVGTLTVQEKKISKEDLDSFMYNTGRYFAQYERLNNANLRFDNNIDRLNSRLQELQFDTREYMLDMISILYKNVPRSSLKLRSAEELLLKYLDASVLDEIVATTAFYPADGIKGAKEISNAVQKLFAEYQKIYAENYTEIKAILQSSKSLGKGVDSKQVDASVKELDELYADSRSADVLNLRLATLSERLKVLAATEQKN